MGKPRTEIFIDAPNLYKGFKRAEMNPNINYHKFIRLLSGGYKLERAYVYSSSPDASKEPKNAAGHQRWVANLKRNSKITVRLGRLEYRTPNEPPIEKGADTLLTIDMLSGAYEDRFDIAIIVTSDSDFVPLVEKVQKMNKLVINTFVPGFASFHLRQICDSFRAVDKKTHKAVMGN